MRNVTILSCLVLSAVLGVAAILSHRLALQSVVFFVAGVWTLADMVLSGVFSRSYWKARNVPLSQFLYRQARELPQMQGGAIQRVARVGSITFMMTFFALYFF
jgi:hypothetical protein